MASKYWLKLFHETIYDPKIMMRSPGARLRWYECLCLAGDYDKDGELPCIENMVYVFRIEEKQLLDELNELIKTGLVIFENGVYFIKNWHSRQIAMDTNERSLRYRESKQKREYYEHETNVQHTCNDNATIRDADIEVDKDIDKEKSTGVRPIQRMIELVVKLPPSGVDDILAMDEIEKMNPLQEDIQEAYNFLVGQGKRVTRYTSLPGCVRTAIAKRVQTHDKPKKIVGKLKDGTVVYE